MRVVVFLIIVLAVLPARAQTTPPLPGCSERPTYLDNPWTDGTRWCLEYVIEDASAGQLGFTALATAPDGTLYAARPLTGEVFALTDANGDGLPEMPTLAADGLTLPNALTYHDDALYIAGGARIDRLRDGELVTLVDDLPAGEGVWTGGIVVHDERLYVGTGAPCDCVWDDPERGAILSFTLDGDDRQVVATGLRQPADLAARDGVLWVTDSADPRTPDSVDELNRVTPGEHFGFPYCGGADNQRVLNGDFDCADATPPAFTFPQGSTPIGLAAYESSAIPSLRDSLLVVLGGSTNLAYMQGFALVSLTFDEGNPQAYSLMIPAQSAADAERFTLQHMNYRTSGFWPRRPLDVTVSSEGWVYLSAGDGRIFALRPL